MHRLVGIELRGPTHVTDAGLEHIGALKQLRELGIGSSRITDAGLVHLAELKRLEHLASRLQVVTLNGRDLYTRNREPIAVDSVPVVR